MAETQVTLRSNGARAQGHELRRAILDTTRRLLLEDGYNAVSMRKIAKSVGCSATSIYLHFDSKDALIHALIDEGMGKLHDVLAEAAQNAAGPVERIEDLCRAYVNYGLQNPEYYEVMFMLHPERMERYPAEKYRRARRNLESFAEAIGAASQTDEVEVEDPEIAASVLWTALHGAVALLLARRIDVRIDQGTYVNAVIMHAMSGLRSHT